jgi:acylphosphatase
MLRWCEVGPRQATVEDVDAEVEDAGGDLSGFEVR